MKPWENKNKISTSSKEMNVTSSLVKQVTILLNSFTSMSLNCGNSCKIPGRENKNGLCEQLIGVFSFWGKHCSNHSETWQAVCCRYAYCSDLLLLLMLSHVTCKRLKPVSIFSLKRGRESELIFIPFVFFPVILLLERGPACSFRLFIVSKC